MSPGLYAGCFFARAGWVEDSLDLAVAVWRWSILVAIWPDTPSPRCCIDLAIFELFAFNANCLDDDCLLCVKRVGCCLAGLESLFAVKALLDVRAYFHPVC